MRYLFGFLCVCALGLTPLVGCSESAQCRVNKDCDDGNPCTHDHCTDWLCTDDGCHSVPNTCDPTPLQDSTPCDFDGLAGVCISGVCAEDPCAGDPCDDGNECTYDECDFRDGLCDNSPVGGGLCDWNGEPGVCIDGVCEEHPCKGVVCDDGDLCTDDRCLLHGDYHNGGPYMHYGCLSTPKNCPDGNQCTYDTCDDPDTGECNHTPAPDGAYCCLNYDWCWAGIGLGYEYCCKVYGECLDAVCVERQP